MFNGIWERGNITQVELVKAWMVFESKPANLKIKAKSASEMLIPCSKKRDEAKLYDKQITS